MGTGGPDRHPHHRHGADVHVLDQHVARTDVQNEPFGAGVGVTTPYFNTVYTTDGYYDAYGRYHRRPHHKGHRHYRGGKAHRKAMKKARKAYRKEMKKQYKRAARPAITTTMTTIEPICEFDC